MNYTIIKIEEGDKWRDYVQKAKYYDFYHSWYYHHNIKNGEAFLFVYEKEAAFIAIPLIKRAINGSDCFDLTSAYGYLGPITNLDVEELSREFLLAFRAAFLDFMAEEKIVCAFSRLHPLLHQVALLDDIGGVYENGSTVYIDLESSIEQQTRHYRKSVKNSIHALAESSPSVKVVETAAELETFVSIYTENMKRIGAHDYYHFDLQYFKELIGAEEFLSLPLMLYLDGVAIAAGFFVYTNDIIQVHLLATKTEFLHLSPTKLLIHEASRIGRERGMRYLHLGGGVGGKNDSLFFWKSGFSDRLLSFRTWRYINNQAEYDRLKAKVVLHEPKDNDFFPAYRALEKQ